jgi:lia operon protein LiaG
MKTKSIILIFICIILKSGIIISKDYKIPVGNIKNGLLSLAGFKGNIIIEGYIGDDIIFTSADVKRNHALSIEKNDNLIAVAYTLPQANKTDFTISVPENFSIKIENERTSQGIISIRKMKSEIEIQTNHDISLEDVSGPLVLSTISGNIGIKSTVMNATKPYYITSVSGKIDISLPAELAANIDMGSETGNLYYNFDYNGESQEMKLVDGNHLTYKLNGGGIKFRIATVSGNVYLRSGYWESETGIGEEAVPPYEILHSLGYSRCILTKINEIDNNIRFRFYRGGYENIDLEPRLIYTSGYEYHTHSYFGIKNPMFPIDIQVEFSAPNYFNTNSYTVKVDLRINEPGTWEVKISY